MNINRKEFLTGILPAGGGMLLGGTLFSGCSEQSSQSSRFDLPGEGATPGPVTVYYEFRIAQPEVQGMLDNVRDLASSLKLHEEFRGLSLKRMIGESTMVKNFPESYKGMLNTAYEDAAKEKTLPHFYALFVRFQDGGDAYRMMKDYFRSNIAPRLHMYAPGKGKTPLVLDYHAGIYQTVVAGNRNEIYRDHTGFLKYMDAQEDVPSRNLVTVGNQVVIDEKNRELFETRIVELLKTAQKTYQPQTNSENGNPGDGNNRFYRSAVTTEILRNAVPDGNSRNYIMHGTWESYWDHENSHLDIRFKKASMPVGSLVIAGPFEPFYRTEILVQRDRG